MNLEKLEQTRQKINDLALPDGTALSSVLEPMEMGIEENDANGTLELMDYNAQELLYAGEEPNNLLRILGEQPAFANYFEHYTELDADEMDEQITKWQQEFDYQEKSETRPDIEKLLEDITALDGKYPHLSDMMIDVVKIKKFSELDENQLNHTRWWTYFNDNLNPNELFYVRTDSDDTYKVLSQALLEYYSDADLSSGFVEEIPDGGTIDDLDPNERDIQGIKSMLQLEFDSEDGLGVTIEAMRAVGFEPVVVDKFQKEKEPVIESQAHNTEYSPSLQDKSLDGNGLLPSGQFDRQFPRASYLHFNTTIKEKPVYRKGWRSVSQKRLDYLNDNAQKIQEAAIFYDEKLSNQTIHFIYVENQEYKDLAVHFYPKNFMHLTGISFEKKAEKSLKDLVEGRGEQKEIFVKADRTLEFKLAVLDSLPQILDYNAMLLNDLSKVEQAQRLKFSEMVKTKDERLGLAFKEIENEELIPNSLISLAQAPEYLSLPERQVLAVLSQDYDAIGGRRIGSISLSPVFSENIGEFMNLQKMMLKAIKPELKFEGDDYNMNVSVTKESKGMSPALENLVNTDVPHRFEGEGGSFAEKHEDGWLVTGCQLRQGFGYKSQEAYDYVIQHPELKAEIPIYAGEYAVLNDQDHKELVTEYFTTYEEIEQEVVEQIEIYHHQETQQIAELKTSDIDSKFLSEQVADIFETVDWQSVGAYAGEIDWEEQVKSFQKTNSKRVLRNLDSPIENSVSNDKKIRSEEKLYLYTPMSEVRPHTPQDIGTVAQNIAEMSHFDESVKSNTIWTIGKSPTIIAGLKHYIDTGDKKRLSEASAEYFINPTPSDFQKANVKKFGIKQNANIEQFTKDYHAQHSTHRVAQQPTHKAPKI